MSADRTRVVLVEDHRLLAESMALALSAEGFDAAVVTTSVAPCSADGLLESILASAPHVVLLDLDLGPAGDGAALIGPLREGGCAVVVVSGVSDPARWGECLARGACTVLPKSASLDDIAATVRRARLGRPVVPPARHRELIRHWQHQSEQVHGARAQLARLTPREEQVLAALVAGRRVREISARSVVSEETVRSQVKSILAKLRVSSQLAAVAVAQSVGWQPGGRATGSNPSPRLGK